MAHGLKASSCDPLNQIIKLHSKKLDCESWKLEKAMLASKTYVVLAMHDINKT